MGTTDSISSPQSEPSKDEKVVTHQEYDALSRRIADLEVVNNKLKGNIAPWESKFYAGIGFLVGAAFLLFHMTLIIALNKEISWSQVVGVLAMAAAMVSIVWGFIYYTINLRSK